MKYAKVLNRSADLTDRGDVDGAIKLLEKFLADKNPSQKFVDFPKACIYLGYIYSLRGNYSEAFDVLEPLSGSELTDIFSRGHALNLVARVHRQFQRFEEAEKCFREIFKLTEGHEASEPSPEYKKLMLDVFGSRGQMRKFQQRWQESLEDLKEALDWLISLSSDKNCTKDFIIIYINLYHLYMILGKVDTAKEYLLLTHAKIQTLESPYSYGMTLFFENLATHNLFAAHSPHEAIKSLNNISEEVVNNFADFRKVFDFFSSIIVQLHEGKMDLEKIRESIREYGDDPLIKAYLPTLLTGAPPPGDGDGDDDIAAATLTD